MNAAILLAAGCSRRLGTPKQLLDWQGRPLVAHAIEQLMSAGCAEIVVVLGAYAPDVQAVCEATAVRHRARLSVAFVENDRWCDGQASSMRCGVEYVLQGNSHSALIVMALCDQPYVLAKHYRRLIVSFADAAVDVAATRYESGGGAPACFRHSVLHELMPHRGDVGAKGWIRGLLPHRVRLVDLPEAANDIDTPAAVPAWYRS